MKGINVGTDKFKKKKNTQESFYFLFCRNGARADKPDYRKSVIQRSILNSNQRFFHLLLDFCSMEELDVANAEGATPLMLACQTNNPSTVKELVDHKVRYIYLFV
jgi:ankyrin repeat protein